MDYKRINGLLLDQIKVSVSPTDDSLPLRTLTTLSEVPKKADSHSTLVCNHNHFIIHCKISFLSAFNMDLHKVTKANTSTSSQHLVGYNHIILLLYGPDQLVKWLESLTCNLEASGPTSIRFDSSFFSKGSTANYNVSRHRKVFKYI